MQRYVGIDFGTTNSAVAVAEGTGQPSLVSFPSRAGPTETFRSVLYFDPDHRNARGLLEPLVGPRAIECYLDGHGDGRLIQSVKSYVASRSFVATSVFERKYTLEDLVALILRGLREASPQGLLAEGAKVVVGRPVRFAHADTAEDDAFAVARLRRALQTAGFGEVTFELEPVAAAWYYSSTLDHDELCLIGDFGGGTSDFSLMRAGPNAAASAAGPILGTEGVALAGDAFDGRIVDRLVSPRLGLGSEYRAYFDAKTIPVPAWIYAKLRRWHHLSFLKSRETMRLLRELEAQAEEPEKLAALVHLVESDLGYELYRAIERAKVGLSSAAHATFDFHDPPVDLGAEVERASFEAWIDDELCQIAACVDRLLEKTGVSAGDVGSVFLTGGSSFVPAVRALFERRFGAKKLRGGNEMTSVALGLALRAREVG